MSKFSFSYLSPFLKNKFNFPLPGPNAQMRMAPEHRVPASVYLEQEKDFKTGCVMILLFPDRESGETRIIFIERQSGDHVHSSQIAFPGGRLEESDISKQDAALRETEEEIGIHRSSIKILGDLTQLYIPPSKFLVFPFVGIIENTPEFNINEHEVQRVLTPHLKSFTEEVNIFKGDFLSSRGYRVNAPFYAIENVKIWGASAMMMSELVSMLD